jgi:hypothetical protein
VRRCNGASRRSSGGTAGHLPSPTEHPSTGRQLKSYAKDREERPMGQKEGLELNLVGAFADAVDTSTPIRKPTRSLTS